MRSGLFSRLSRDVLVRVAADFAIVHIAALVSLAGVLLWRFFDTPNVDGEELAAALRRIYITRFLPSSLLFPLVFSFSGFYSQARSYAVSYKWRAVARGSIAATLIYVFADFLMTRVDLLPRSSALMFLVLVVLGTVGARLLKYWLVQDVRTTGFKGVPESHGPVLVVGGAGYIGSLLCRKLLTAGTKVRVLDDLVYGDSSVRDLLGNPGFELIHGDCRSIQSVVGAVNGVDSIVHLAAIVGDPACEQDRQAALEVNYAATRMLIEIAKGNGVQRMIFASSCSVYGATHLIMDEQSEVRPISLYAQTKVDSEQALLAARGADFHPTVLRLATVFGHSYRPRFDLVVNLLAAKAYRDGLITIYNGDQWRPFIHVADVADGILAVLRAPLASVSGEIFNLGDSRLNFTLSAVAGIIQRVFPATRIEHVENTDRRNYRVSFDKIRNRLGFECSLRIEDGVAELKRAFEEGKVLDFGDALYHNQRFLQARPDRIPRNEMDVRVMAAFAGPPAG